MLLIQVNDQAIAIPTTLRDITIEQRINFAVEYGDDLDERLQELRDMPDGPEKEIAMLDWQFDKMFKEFSFFSGVPVGVLRNSAFVDHVADIYFANMVGLIENE